jgi:hypothetical protein
LAVSACGGKERVVTQLPTPPERLICEEAGTRPTVPAEYRIDWNHVSAAPTVAVAVERARSEVGRLIASIRTREGIVAAYIVQIEGKLFVCSNNAQWRRDYEAGLARSSN